MVWRTDRADKDRLHAPPTLLGMIDPGVEIGHVHLNVPDLA
jgi:hypothetical protein